MKCNNFPLRPGQRMGVAAMIIRVDDITAEAKELLFAESEREVNHILDDGKVREYHLESPIAVEVSYYRAGTELFFSGMLNLLATASCSRCAEDFSFSNRRAFRFVLVPKVIGSDGQADLRAEDLEFSTYTGEEVDLTPLIREQALLGLPTRPLCREDCRGLCPHCGINLNESGCDCRDEGFDPRLAVLRSFKLRGS